VGSLDIEGMFSSANFRMLRHSVFLTEIVHESGAYIIHSFKSYRESVNKQFRRFGIFHTHLRKKTYSLLQKYENIKLKSSCVIGVGFLEANLLLRKFYVAQGPSVRSQVFPAYAYGSMEFR
jgi:hypothetical protein